MTLPAYAMNQASFPQTYERSLVGSIFGPWADVLLERAAFSPGDRLLDIACGTGIVARRAKERAGSEAGIVGVDVSEPMLAVARSVAPEIDWREGSASALPIADAERFDVVTCQQGLQFFPDRDRAVREMRRALLPNGRLAVATWRSARDNSCFGDLQRVAERHLGPIDDSRFALFDGRVLEDLLVRAGFANVRVETLSRSHYLDDGVLFARLNAMALIAASAKAAQMGEQDRMQLIERIVQDSRPALSRYANGSDGAIEFEMSTNLGTAEA